MLSSNRSPDWQYKGQEKKCEKCEEYYLAYCKHVKHLEEINLSLYFDLISI